MASYHGTGRWLTEQQYEQIRRKAKRMGAKDVCLTSINHFVRFEYVYVDFAFHPFVAFANFCDGDPYEGSFSDEDSAERIKTNMDVALAFIDYLRAFNAKLGTNN